MPLNSGNPEGTQTGTDYIVEQGDCIASIAQEHGFFWQTVWNDSKNADLRRKRQNPNILLPGDHVHIPERRMKWEAKPAGQKHQFVLKGVPALFRLRLLKDRKPRANLEYLLRIDDKSFHGKTDANGELVHPIPPNAQRGFLRVRNESGWEEERELLFGCLDPKDAVSGALARLRNLGYDLGEEDEEVGPGAEEAIRRYQRDCNLPITGKLDESTCNRLMEEHDSGDTALNPDGSFSQVPGPDWAVEAISDESAVEIEAEELLDPDGEPIDPESAEEEQEEVDEDLEGVSST